MAITVREGLMDILRSGAGIELTIGEPEQWVPGHPGHDAVRQQARRVLPPPY